MANDRLTATQERFVLEYLRSLNATQAAIKAGYSAKTAEAIGSRLLRNVKVSTAIETGRQATAEKLQISREELIRQAKAIMDGDGPARDRLKANELIGKYLGLFERKLRHEGTIRQVVIHEGPEPLSDERPP